jgi:prepilin-type N-terminal cleavage/methylation domain-containing protein
MHQGGFTLVELIAALTIAAILAAIAVPRLTASRPFNDRGYADEVAGALREARAVAMASGCAVRFAIDTNGYSVMQHAAAGTHCAPAGGWTTAVLRGDGQNLAGWPRGGTNVTAARTLVFAIDGSVLGGAPVAIAIGAHSVQIDAGGWVDRL